MRLPSSLLEHLRGPGTAALLAACSGTTPVAPAEPSAPAEPVAVADPPPPPPDPVAYDVGAEDERLARVDAADAEAATRRARWLHEAAARRRTAGGGYVPLAACGRG